MLLTISNSLRLSCALALSAGLRLEEMEAEVVAEMVAEIAAGMEAEMEAERVVEMR